MATERDDSLQSISARFDGKNYAYWSYVMRNFLMGKKMWGYACGMKSRPIEADNEKYEEQMEVWQVNNSKIITWINNLVDNSIGMQLAKYDTAKQVWDHLERLYIQSNFAKQYQLEMDIRTFQQKDMSIQDFYSAMTNFWDQLAMTESAELRAFPPYIARCEEQRLVQFLMALRDDFEALRGNILHRSPKPIVDAVVSELIAEELRLKSGTMKRILPSPNQSVLAVHSLAVASSSSATSAETLLEQLQKLLNQQPHDISAAAGLLTLSSTGISSSEWILDSGASHHMSPTADSFTSLIPSDSVSVVTADGTPMPLAGVGSIVSSYVSLPRVYHIPKLVLNLISVGQLCDSGCIVTFSSTDCRVQDLYSKRRIGTGHRQGGLYIMDDLQVPDVAASSVDLSGFHLSPSSSDFYLWHSRLGHVSSSHLNYLISIGSLGKSDLILTDPFGSNVDSDPAGIDHDPHDDAIIPSTSPIPSPLPQADDPPPLRRPDRIHWIVNSLIAALCDSSFCKILEHYWFLS
ncbi:hypothetical protein C2S53_007300 [Perilla frutescens var. hirtella]|uniref:Retrotransposon Copia-like N-terminal domain-containing protein n=1 Tax=Perilla frutescens var. hirtella TaxID=608512 RepID=A0AAD4JJB9_PERFH|nr:hypothetical protein C2S53_007300 [Perilla frutescens var. hirtella]